ncbi:MAG: hypothetical protein HZA50_12335 [Planctomycetes bacterium]|nr:hypothetical protein [Planctomycetota bacterium]
MRSALAALIKPPATSQATVPAVSQEEIKKLIAQLGDNESKVREAATEKLIQIGESVLPAIREIAKNKDSDPEAASRAKFIFKTLGGDYVANLRMLVSRVAAGDELRLAIHWEAKGEDGKDGPLPTVLNVVGKTMPGVDVMQVLADMVFHITTPDGKTTEFRAAKLKDNRQEWARKDVAFFRNATYFLVLDKSGLSAGEISGAWDGVAPALSAEGIYKLRVSGVLKIGTHTVARDGMKDVREVKYEVGPAPFVVAAGAKSVAEIRRAALAALKQHAPDAAGEPQGHVESADVKGLVCDGSDGTVQVYARGQPGKSWSYPLYRVDVTPAGEVVRVSSREISTCVAAGTKIDTPGGGVAVEKLAEGDHVWAYDLQRKQRVTATVRTIRVSERDEVMAVGNCLRVTGEHPVWAGGQWKRADTIVVGDVLQGPDGVVKLDAAPRLVRGKVAVFDVTVDGPHNFFAGGLLVHNKDRGWSKDLDDAWYFYFGEKEVKWTVVWARSGEATSQPAQNVVEKPAATSPATVSAVSQKEIKKLIAQLGDNDSKVREAATERLIQIGGPVLPAIREIIKNKDSDPEIIARAKVIIRKCALSGELVPQKDSFALGQPVKFKFVLVNSADQAVKIWSRGCSWGYEYGCFKFNITLPDGKTIEAVEPEKAWERNIPGLALIGPEAKFKVDINLAALCIKGPGGEISIEKQLVSGKYRIVGQYSSRGDPKCSIDQSDLWTGELKTQPVEFTILPEGQKAPEADNPKYSEPAPPKPATEITTADGITVKLLTSGKNPVKVKLQATDSNGKILWVAETQTKAEPSELTVTNEGNILVTPGGIVVDVKTGKVMSIER